MFDNLHVIITLFAAICVTIFSLIFNGSLLHTAISLIFTIILFFTLGFAFKSFLMKSLQKEEASLEELEAEEFEEVEMVEE